MLNILGMIILIIILLIIIFLYLGVRIAFIYDKSGPKFQGCLKILILKKICIYTNHFPNPEDDEEEKEEDEEEKEEEESKKRDIKKILDLAKPCLGYIKEFLQSTAKCIRISKLENHLIFGLDSYVDTAKYIGYIWGMLVIVNSHHENARLTAVPSFNGSAFDVKGDNELDINLLKMALPTIKLVSKKEVRDLIRGLKDG